MKKILSVFLFCSVLSSFLYAQSLKDGRVEIQVSSISDDYYLLPIGQNGVLLFGESDKVNSAGVDYEFTKYNTNFKKEWVTSVSIKDRLYLRKQYYDSENGKLYLLMAKQKGQMFLSDFQLVELDVNSKNIQIINGTFPGRVYINDFYANNSMVYFGGGLFPPSSEAFFKQIGTLVLFYIPALFGSMNFKLKPLLYIADFKKKNISQYPFNLNGNSRVTSIALDKDATTVNVFVTSKQSRDKVQFSIFVFDKEGNKTGIIPLKVDDNIDITSGKVMSMDKDEQVVIGTYTQRPKGFKESYFDLQNTTTTTSTGMYYAKIKNGEQEFIKTYPYSKFSNFYKYLTFRSQNSLKKKIARKEAKGKPLNLQYNLLVHNLVKMNDEFVMVAEAYYPEYETNCETVFNPNGSTYQRCYTVFVGYRFTHAIIAGFDEKGELIWDNSFEIMDILTYDLKPKVKFLLEDNEILLVYSFNGELKSKVVSGNEVIEGKTGVKIDTGSADDKVKDSYGSGIEYWYDNYFIAYGYQKIKSDKSSGRSRRKVFYFNKIAYK